MKSDNLNTCLIKNILFFNNTDEHYGLKVLFEFDSQYLFFDSSNFTLLTNPSILFRYPWAKINFQHSDDLTIKCIKADELVNYFILLSDDAIFYIYQTMHGNDFWCQDFEIGAKNQDMDRYNEIYEHMNEDWIEELSIRNE